MIFTFLIDNQSRIYHIQNKVWKRQLPSDSNESITVTTRNNFNTKSDVTLPTFIIIQTTWW